MSGTGKAPAGAAGEGVLAIWHDREDAIAEIYERWYITEHVPERLGVPGFLSARRYESLAGSPRFFTSYDVESVGVLSSPAYLERLAAPSRLTTEVMAHFRNMVRTVCTPAFRSSDRVLGGAVTAGFVQQAARVETDRLLARFAEIERDPRALRVQVWRAATDPAHAATSESKLRPGGDARVDIAVVVDVLREGDARELVAPVLEALREGVAAEPRTAIHVDAYRLLGQWLAPG